ncbi:hypothetical protein [Nocardia brasiliensis]|uniref:hypothetical protein n=1 Tax=Nocardia brasiliensis TaxID=37326 RepID=UPI003D8D9805
MTPTEPATLGRAFLAVLDRTVAQNARDAAEAEARAIAADATSDRTNPAPSSGIYRTPITVVWTNGDQEDRDRRWIDAPDDLDPQAFDAALHDMGWTRISDWDEQWEATVRRTDPDSAPPPSPTDTTEPRTATLLRLTPEAVVDYEALT